MSTTTLNPASLRPEPSAEPRWTPLDSSVAGPGAAVLALLTLASTPAHADNAVVIDFDQGRLILGWIGLWAVAVLAFMLCADKRLAPFERLSRYLDERARRNAQQHADNQVLDVAQDDPRIMADIRAVLNRSGTPADEPAASASEPDAVTPQTVRPAVAGRTFQTSPMPGLPSHMQYLEG